MPKINLLEGQEFSQEIDLERAGEIPIPEEIARPEGKIVETAPDMEKTVEKERPIQEQKETTAFRQRRSSPWPIVVAVAVVATIVLLVFLNPFKSSNNDTTEDPGQQTPAVTDPAENTLKQEGEDTTPEEQLTAPPGEELTPGTMSAGLSEAIDLQRRQNAGGATLLGEFISAIPSGMALSFFRYGGENYLAEITASSNSLFADFESSLSRKSEDLVPNTLSEQEKKFGGAVVQVRQIQGTIPIGGTKVSAAGALDTEQIGVDLSAKASQSGLEVRELDVYPEMSSNGYRLRPATMKVFGLQQDVANFIQDMLQSYQNVVLDKVSISVVSPGNLSESRVSAVLDLDVFL